MRISGASVGGGEISGSRKASIERQIKKLEKKRDEILEKLGAKKSSKKQDSAELSTGNLRVNSAGSDGQGSASTPQIGGSDAESGVAAPRSDVFSDKSLDMGQALHDMSKKLSSSSAADGAATAEDPKELMKQLQLIEMQIMALRQQINDDSSEALEVDTEEAAAAAMSGMEAREANRSTDSAAATSLPEVSVSADGHVDGYV